MGISDQQRVLEFVSFVNCRVGRRHCSHYEEEEVEENRRAAGAEDRRGGHQERGRG